MTLDARKSPLLFLLAMVFRQIVRRPFLSLSVIAHAALLALLYYFGSYEPELREQEAEVASSLRATSVASTAKRLQDLQTIKQLLEKSADHLDGQAEESTAPPDPSESLESLESPQEMVEQARKLSRDIEEIDQEIKAEELARLIDAPVPPATAVPPAPTVKPNDSPAPITDEMAASEVAALEAKARATLAQRQQHLEAQANGVEVETNKPAAGGQGAAAGASASRDARRSAGTSTRAEIADFLAAGEGNEQTVTQSTGYRGLNFFDNGQTVIPPVDAATLVRGRGRILGAGGEYANRIYLNSWYLIGPFPGRHGADLFDNPSYPPEKAVLLDAVYYGKDKRLLKWRYVTPQSYPLVPPDLAEDSVYYGYTEVSVDQACDLVAWIGVDDDVQIYLNDRLVWKGGNVNKGSYFNAIFNTRSTYLRDYNRTEGQRVLHFNKGRNKIFFKMSNGPNDPFLSMVLTATKD